MESIEIIGITTIELSEMTRINGNTASGRLTSTASLDAMPQSPLARAQQQAGHSNSGIDELQSLRRPVSPSRMRELRGVCASRPRNVDAVNEITGSGRTWATYRKAHFNQLAELSRTDSNSSGSGACVAFSALWCRQITGRPSQSADSRMNLLRSMTEQAGRLQDEHQTRMDGTPGDLHPFDASTREMGITLDWNNRMRVDVVDDEENALHRLAESLHQDGQAHFIVLGRTPDCPAPGHVVAAQARGGNVVLFDPNLGEFKCNAAQVPTVLRAMIANSSLRYPVPCVETIPLRAESF